MAPRDSVYHPADMDDDERVGGLQLHAPIVETLHYGSLPYLTHPIDLVTGKQGWGWRNGPWMPVEFVNPADAVSSAWAGENTVMISPPYDVATLFDDPSMQRVGNTSFWAALTQAAKAAVKTGSATISNRGGAA